MSEDLQCLQMMAVVLFAVRPLAMQEICLIVDICDPAAIEREISIERQSRLESNFLAFSRGLLFVQSGLVMFIHASAHEHVKKIFMSRLGNGHPDGEMILLRACLLYFKARKEREHYELPTILDPPEIRDGGLPFFRYAVTYWVLHGMRLQRRIDPQVFEREIQSMGGSHFESWKSYFLSVREGSEGNTAQQEVESYFLARIPVVTTPIELVSQIITQVGDHLWVEEAGPTGSIHESDPNLGHRSVLGDKGATGSEPDQKESNPELPRSQGTITARLDKLEHQSVKDGFSPILVEQESALGFDSSEASKIEQLLLTLFLNDDVLRPICKTALETMSPDTFERNLQELLGSFANDLQEEAHEVLEHKISIFCGSNRKHIARDIRTLFTKESSVGKKPNNVNELERFVTNSKAFITMRTSINTFAQSMTSFNSSDPNRQGSAAVPTEERSPMLEEATKVPSNTAQNVETLDIHQASEYQPPFVGSTHSQVLDPPLALNRSLLLHSYRYIVGQVLDFLQGLNLYEPPLPVNYVRLQWICVSLSPP